MHFRTQLSLGVSAVLLLVGCAGEVVVDPPWVFGVTGTYRLASIAGRQMPTWAINQGVFRLDVLSAEFTLISGGVVSGTTTTRVTTTGSASTTTTTTSAGSYTVDGSILRMDMSGTGGGSMWQKTSVGTMSGPVVSFMDDNYGELRYQMK